MDQQVRIEEEHAEWQVAEVMETPAPANKAGGRDGRRTSHVRFCTPAPPAYVPLPTPSQTAGVNSCNAGAPLSLAQA